MRRYWIDEKLLGSEPISIEGELFHHICVVCRQGAGDRFELLSPGFAHLVELVLVEKRGAKARLLEKRPLASLPRPHLHLCLSLPRFQKTDEIIEKSVELGVAQLHPFVSDFSFVREPSKVSAGKRQRWQKILLGATQQSGRGDLMEIPPVLALPDLMDKINLSAQDAGLFLYEGPGQLSLPEALTPLKQQVPENIWFFIGSEGGFSGREVDWFKGRGLKPINLGAQVLRVETACTLLTAILKYEFKLLEDRGRNEQG